MFKILLLFCFGKPDTDNYTGEIIIEDVPAGKQ